MRSNPSTQEAMHRKPFSLRNARSASPHRLSIARSYSKDSMRVSQQRNYGMLPAQRFRTAQSLMPKRQALAPALTRANEVEMIVKVHGLALSGWLGIRLTCLLSVRRGTSVNRAITTHPAAPSHPA